MARKKKYIVFAACKSKKKNRKTKRGGGKISRRRKRKPRFGKQRNFFGSGPKTQVLKTTTPSSKKKIVSEKTIFKKQIPLLKAMSDLPLEDQIVLLHFLDYEACNNIVDCIKKILCGKYLDGEKKQFLKKNLLPYREVLRELANPKNNRLTKKNIPKIGGGLGVLLTAGIPLLLDIARQKKWI